MTTAEITRELRAARPVASQALRAQVAETAERQPTVPEPLLQRLLGHRRALALVPAAAVVALAGAVAIGITRPAPATEPATSVATGSSPGESATAGDALSAQTPPAAKAGAETGRAQRITAAITLRVSDGDALATASGEALRITRALGGYVVTSNVVSGEDGSASLSLRVPATAAQDAIQQLSALGTIVDQRIQVDDLQGSLDGLELQLRQTRAALATVRARLATDDLSSEERARLQVRRDELVATLAGLRAQRDTATSEAAEAAVQLELRTDRSAGTIPLPSRLDRTIDRALDVLAWEGVVLLSAAIVLAPLALVALAGWALRRGARRREDDRLLGAA